MIPSRGLPRLTVIPGTPLVSEPLTPIQVVTHWDRVLPCFVFADPTDSLPDEPKLLPSAYGIQVVIMLDRGPQILYSWPWRRIRSYRGSKVSEDPSDMEVLHIIVRDGDVNDDWNVPAITIEFQFQCDTATTFIAAFDSARKSLLYISDPSAPHTPTFNPHSQSLITSLCERGLCVPCYTLVDPLNTLPEELILVPGSKGIQIVCDTSTRIPADPIYESLTFFQTTDVVGYCTMTPEDPTDMDQVVLEVRGMGKYHFEFDVDDAKKMQNLLDFHFPSLSLNKDPPQLLTEKQIAERWEQVQCSFVLAL